MDKEFYSKYIHIAYGHNSKFVAPFVAFLMNEKYGFEPENHYFVAVHKAVYDDLIKVTDRVILDESEDNLYVKYEKHCDWIFSYGGPQFTQLLNTSHRIMKKVILRYGGGSRITHLKFDKHRIIRSLINEFKKYLFRKVYESYAAIGVANNVDILDLSQVLKNVKYYRMGYSSPEKFYAKKRVKEGKLKYELDSTKIKVLLGHRGTEENNHIEILKLLDRFPKDKFDIYIPMSYGNENYIERVKAYIDEKKPENVHVIDLFMPYEQYLTFLNAMDIAIFDGYTSYALGNISVLLYFEKTIYLRKSGVICKVLDDEGTPHRYISDLDKVTFEEFSTLESFGKNWHSNFVTEDFQERINDWKKIFNDFN